MACLGCSCSTSSVGGDDKVGGCGGGGCSTGGCNRHNTYDWITALGIADPKPFDTVEVSFKNGARKEFFKNPPYTHTTTGDWVLVESPTGGYDVGKVTLSGELVRLQMKRKRVRPDTRLQTVVRKAHDRDLERLDEVRREEKQIMIQARVIARTLELNMKIGDVEYQGDGRKCTFYYTADGRVDFRELIRSYAQKFKVKIEMRQIGARQESARLGGIGNCGRELCCSTWLTEFKSVNTAAARYQNLAINQTKLSGMCGRLKCCLNYELDTYIDALEDFPDRAERLKTTAGTAILVKTDVFKRLMFYTYAENRGKFYPIHVDQIWEAMAMIKLGKIPGSLEDILAMAPVIESDEPEEIEHDYENVHDVIQLPMEMRKKKRKKTKSGRDRSQSAAAALENAPPPDFERGRSSANRPQGGRSDDRNRRPENRGPRPEGQSARPDNRTPRPDDRRDKQANRPPDNRTDKPRTDRAPKDATNRPDGPPKDTNEPRTEQPPRDKAPQQPRTEQPGDKGGQPKQPRPPRTDNKSQEPRSPRTDNRPPQEPRAPKPPREGEANKPGNDAVKDPNRIEQDRRNFRPKDPKK